MTDTELFPLVSLKVDQMLMFKIKDGFNMKDAHIAHCQIVERAERYGYIVRIQKYLHKLYVIRVT